MSRLPEVANPHRRFYSSDLSNREWEIIKPLLPAKDLEDPEQLT